MPFQLPMLWAARQARPTVPVDAAGPRSGDRGPGTAWFLLLEGRRRLVRDYQLEQPPWSGGFDWMRSATMICSSGVASAASGAYCRPP